MKILLVCEHYYPFKGGAELLFQNLAEGFVQKGHTVTVLTQRLPNTKKEEYIHGVKICRLTSFSSRYLFTFVALPKALWLAKDHDVIQTTTFNGAFPAWVAGKILRKPVVLTVHEVWKGKWKEVTHFPRWKCLLHDLLERTLYILPFSRYICVSQSTEKELHHQKNKQTIYNGLDYQFWNSANINQQVVQDIKPAAKFLFFSWGRPGPSKGFEYLLQTIPAIKKEVPHAHFRLMLGSVHHYPKKYAELLALREQLQLQDCLEILPSLPPEQLRNHLAAADCVIVPSLAEGFGYAAAEAAAMDKPILSSNAGSLPEIVSGKHLFFEKKNIPDLVQKAILASKGKYHYTTKKEFPWEESVTGYLKIYQELLQR